jgi:heme/copper-type cytochrome/quinol oxidase subunit 2
MGRALILVPLLLLVLVGLFFVLRPDSPASNASAEGQQEKTFDLAIQEGAMTPGEIKVDEGNHVNLQMTADSPIAFYLYGYDLYAKVGPGEPGELSFDATIAGRFEIENHNSNPHEVLGELLVRPR